MANAKVVKTLCLYTLCSILTPTPLVSGDPVVVSGGPENDYESWIIRPNDNRLMIIFDRNPDWQSGDLYATFSTDNGDTWETPIAIIEGPGDQATLSFLQLPGDTLRLWYASNEYGTYGIHTAHSSNSIDWNRDGPIELGWGSTSMHYDPTVIIEPDSSLTMSYRGPQGAYIAHHPHGGTWDTLKTLVGPSGYRPRLMKHTSGVYLFSYHRNTGSGYDVFVRTSEDRVNWTDELRLTYSDNSHDPFPNETSDGAYLIYYATYLTPAYNLYRRRSYDAINWEYEEQVTFDATNNTQPHFFMESSETFLVWAHAVTFPNDHDVYFEKTPYVGIDENIVWENKNTPTPVSICPNPCAQRAMITLKTMDHPDSRISIYDIQGRDVTSMAHISPCAGNSLELDTSHLPVGVYCLKMEHPRNDGCVRLVVIR
ncbi:hypothetical protein AMJ83_00910 [candidate division WOR_3 bacterium SM23_42]|uniref:Secretion system C-terminal sorting domain-containing protein n=1 Tax=candidate division WOR_3 bacterium SM23_42 TaxID=1703779 RepID=A0A0S8FXF7_UNCW3|nr:MAG: hypothetical protein AMJ83_00910 [candidate division WOR_3 bacterium SM23_42]